MALIEIEPHCICQSSHKIYDVTIHGTVIRTMVTSSRKIASKWIKIHLLAPCCHLRKVVGLDIEWRPSFTRGVHNPVAIIQLCIKSCCLIFQLHQASSVPRSLYRALDNPNITYTGVGISRDAEKLEEDYGLEIASFADIAKMAAKVFDKTELKRVGLKTLVEICTGEKIDKRIAMSNWETKTLTCAQVGYASADAYFSYKFGKWLLKLGRSSRNLVMSI